MSSTIESPWRTDEPPKDGSMIVALGNITERHRHGESDVSPFTDAIFWNGEDWITNYGLALRIFDDAEVTILMWLPYPA